MTDDTLTRWTSFVAKTRERYDAILTESNAGFESLLREPDLHPITFGNAMRAIESRVQDLIGKLGTIYAQNVVGSLFFVGDAERLLTETSSWMGTNFEHWRVRWNGRLARSMWARAQPLVHAPKSCTKCGAELANRTTFHQSESVQCKHCQAVNSVSPDAIVCMYFATAPDMIADEATISTKLQLGHDWHRMSKAQIAEQLGQHWRAYVSARSQITPMSAEEQDRFVEAKTRSQLDWRS